MKRFRLASVVSHGYFVSSTPACRGINSGRDLVSHSNGKISRFARNDSTLMPELRHYASPSAAKGDPTLRWAAGFNLLEMLVVLLLIGVLSAVVVSRYPSIARYDLASETETLKGHLRYAQLRAISGMATWGIQLANTQYTLVRNGATAPFNLPGENSPVHTLSAGISISSGSGTLISFDSWGSPGVANLSVTLNSGTEARTIVVGRNTGFIP